MMHGFASPTQQQDRFRGGEEAGSVEVESVNLFYVPLGSARTCKQLRVIVDDIANLVSKSFPDLLWPYEKGIRPRWTYREFI